MNAKKGGEGDETYIAKKKGASARAQKKTPPDRRLGVVRGRNPEKRERMYACGGVDEKKQPRSKKGDPSDINNNNRGNLASTC